MVATCSTEIVFFCKCSLNTPTFLVAHKLETMCVGCLHYTPFDNFRLMRQKTKLKALLRKVQKLQNPHTHKTVIFLTSLIPNKGHWEFTCDQLRVHKPSSWGHSTLLISVSPIWKCCTTPWILSIQCTRRYLFSDFFAFYTLSLFSLCPFWY